MMRDLVAVRQENDVVEMITHGVGGWGLGVGGWGLGVGFFVGVAVVGWGVSERSS